MSLTPLSILLAALVALVGVADQWSEHVALGAWRYVAVLVLLGLAYEWWWVHRCRLRASVRVERLRLGRNGPVTIVLENGDASWSNTAC